MADDLDAQMDAIKGGLRVHLEREMVALAFEVTANLAHDTPVDTGFAASNWIPGYGDGAQAPDGSPAELSTAARDAGLALIAGYRLEMGAIVIANPVGYVRWLNYGTSHQAPAGFVELATDRAIATRQGATVEFAERGDLFAGPIYSPRRQDRQRIRESLRPKGGTL